METIGKLRIVPTPKQVRAAGAVSLYKTELFLLHEEFKTAAEVFTEYAAALGIRFTFQKEGAFRIARDPALSPGSYRLEAGNGRVTVSASDSTGANYAFATLLQMMKTEAGESGNVFLADCDMIDAPDCSYRGMMVDLARNWHDFSYLLDYVDLCYFYKISVLHLHFTDDQSYTLPSALFPKLPTEGRSYTPEQIRQLNLYAEARGVSLMPEIDVPGHCVSFQKEYPHIFGTQGIICQHPETLEAMQAIFHELCEMFPYAKYIHIGGDEAQIENWLKCPQCAEYARSIGVDTAAKDRKPASEQLYANFVSKMADAVFSKGKIPVAWEGFSAQVNDLVSKRIILMSWENYYQVTPDLIRAGYQVINCSWNPMYIVTPRPVWPPEEVYRWNIFRWIPVHGGSPYIGTGLEIEPTDQVIGGQLLAWGDQIPSAFPTIEEGVAAERDLLLERLPFVAENTWNKAKSVSFEDITAASAQINDKLRKIIARAKHTD